MQLPLPSRHTLQWTTTVTGPLPVELVQRDVVFVSSTQAVTGPHPVAQSQLPSLRTLGPNLCGSTQNQVYLSPPVFLCDEFVSCLALPLVLAACQGGGLPYCGAH